MQKEKRLGAEGVGEGVYGLDMGRRVDWRDALADADGWELGYSRDQDQRQGSAGVWRCNGRRSVKSKPNRRYRLVSEKTGWPCEMDVEHRGLMSRVSFGKKGGCERRGEDKCINRALSLPRRSQGAQG